MPNGRSRDCTSCLHEMTAKSKSMPAKVSRKFFNACEAAPRNGRLECAEHPNEFVSLNQGEPMPQLRGKRCRWTYRSTAAHRTWGIVGYVFTAVFSAAVGLAFGPMVAEKLPSPDVKSEISQLTLGAADGTGAGCTFYIAVIQAGKEPINNVEMHVQIPGFVSSFRIALEDKQVVDRSGRSALSVVPMLDRNDQGECEVEKLVGAGDPDIKAFKSGAAMVTASDPHLDDANAIFLVVALSDKPSRLGQPVSVASGTYTYERAWQSVRGKLSFADKIPALLMKSAPSTRPNQEVTFPPVSLPPGN